MHVLTRCRLLVDHQDPKSAWRSPLRAGKSGESGPDDHEVECSGRWPCRPARYGPPGLAAVDGPALVALTGQVLGRKTPLSLST